MIFCSLLKLWPHLIFSALPSARHITKLICRIRPTETRGQQVRFAVDAPITAAAFAPG
jgi:hypothetical protein